IYYVFSKTLAEHAVIAKVNGELWDLLRPFEKNSSLEIYNFDHKDVTGSLGVILASLFFGCHQILCYGKAEQN
ncbi:threonyl-tRNA synthetase-related, partial [Schistosoma mansoni]|uniref:threonyl-tRNA synthetase-related n=1 Tax=Schistosoma mansoni TaxID=6183 RepID=UPI00022DC968